MRTIEDGEAEQPRHHPVDVVEFVASSREWAFERCCDDELALSVAGARADYAVTFAWIESCEALHLGCSFDLAASPEAETEILRLASQINGQLVVGHFDLLSATGSVTFRHALPLPSGATATSGQAERLLAAALDACERFHPAFVFVAKNGRSAREALTLTLFETVGNA